jgi:hypothetical protein
MPTRIIHDEDGIIRNEQEEEGCERHHIRSKWIGEEEEEEDSSISISIENSIDRRRWPS